MEARVDRAIAKVRAIHQDAEERGLRKVEGETAEITQKRRRELAEAADVVLVSHGHFSRCFIA